MSTETLEISQEQADRIRELAKLTQMTVTQIVGVMVELTSAVSGKDTLRVSEMMAELEHRCPQQAYSREQFMNDLAAANLAGDVEAAEAAPGKARAASIGFNSAVGRTRPDGVAYQNALEEDRFQPNEFME